MKNIIITFNERKQELSFQMDKDIIIIDKFLTGSSNDDNDDVIRTTTLSKEKVHHLIKKLVQFSL